MEQTTKRLKLEREQNKHLQYTICDSVEIHGIPTNIPQGQLEDEVIKIYNAAKIDIHGQSLRKIDMQACHRIGRKQEKTVVKFLNRKFSVEELYNGKNLQLYGSKVFINNSFCEEFRHLNYIIRKLKSDERIF